ncbi:hypothetical protein DPMN_064457 [Dreissena polymorpha]|uniref:Homeobox domain-containing protein n=1 Tax=Dreissena polymorpha TaxID=45954 RepID=A0A9D4CDM1_DREPO|nr:hypothetical protein DPMN_064457 [Dreissena polymorpha]
MKLTYNPTSGKTGSQRQEQTTFTREQLDALEAVYSNTSHPDVQVRVRLAIKLGLSGNNVMIWFKNRRSKTENTDNNDGSKGDPNFPRSDTRTIYNDDVSKLAQNDHLLKKRTPNKDCVNNMTQKQPKKRLRCVDVSEGEAWMPRLTSTPISCATEHRQSITTLNCSETNDVSFTEHYVNEAKVMSFITNFRIVTGR